MDQHRIVPHDQWIAARRDFLAKEKEFTRLRDELSRERRELPWERVEKNYVFDGPSGKESLADLFAGKSQLIVYHLMFAPDWDAACKSCSFWADNFNNIPVHLKHRDIALIAISRAPLAKLEAYRKRMGWSFKWVSSGGNDFNYDYRVSFTPNELEKGELDYNYGKVGMRAPELPGISVFYKDNTGAIFHTYSCYARGLDMMNGAYSYMDLAPKGRDEAGQTPHAMAWVRRHDEYDD
ncbi:MAG: thioredoxin family protein [Dongiaceae bacterium]